MKRLLLWIFFLFVCVVEQICSAEWVSPIDEKYSLKNPELYDKYVAAYDLLDQWRGQRDKLKRAQALLDEILENDDLFAPAYREYGRLRIMNGVVRNGVFREGSLASAEASILKSLEIEPDYADSYVLLGHLYTRMLRFEDAEQSLKKAESIGTEIPWLELNWADLLKRQGKLKESADRYNRVLNKGTTNRKAYLAALSGITDIYTSTGQLDKADEVYKLGLEYESSSAWDWGNYASFQLFLHNDVDGAIESARKALSIMDYGVGRLTLGTALYTKWALLKSKDENSEEAEKYFQEAWGVYPFPERVIEEADRFPGTMVTAESLREWMEKEQVK